MIIQQAVRWQMDPFAVAQECSVIQGKLMHSGKLVAAVINSRGNLAQRLSFAYAGTNGNRTITVSGRLQGETEARTVDVKLADAKTNNRVWQSQPDQQLMYHGCRVWARRHTPELMLGVWSPEEFDEATNGNGAVVIEHDPPVRKSSAAAKRDGDWPRFQAALADCQSAREVEMLRVEWQRDFYPAWNKDWQAVADEALEKRLAEFSEPEHLEETLQDSIEIEQSAQNDEAVRDELIERMEAMDSVEALLRLRDQADFQSVLQRLPAPMQLTVRKYGATLLKKLPTEPA